MNRGVVASVGFVGAIVALLILQLTTPQMVGPLGVLAFFVLVYIVCACLIYIILASLIGVLGRTVKKGKWLARLDSMSKRRIYYYTSFIALAPVILMGMQSVGQVRVTDMLLLLAFQVIGCFYISRRF